MLCAMEKSGFFEERQGVKSSTRLFGLLLLIFMMGFDLSLALTVGFVMTYNFVLLNLVFLIAIFAPKYLQKLVESKFTRGGQAENISVNQGNVTQRLNGRGNENEDINLNAPA